MFAAVPETDTGSDGLLFSHYSVTSLLGAGHFRSRGWQRFGGLWLTRMWPWRETDSKEIAMDDPNHGSRFISCIAGVRIGALAGVLFAPRSGKEMC